MTHAGKGADFSSVDSPVARTYMRPGHDEPVEKRTSERHHAGLLAKGWTLFTPTKIVEPAAAAPRGKSRG